MGTGSSFALQGGQTIPPCAKVSHTWNLSFAPPIRLHGILLDTGNFTVYSESSESKL
jgi:hypothetical protein